MGTSARRGRLVDGRRMDWPTRRTSFDHPEQCPKASYDYFAAVPENCHSLTVKVHDFDTDAELTTLPWSFP